MESASSKTETADPLSLRAWPAKNEGAPSIPTLIERITAQKGSFRNVTEQSLEEEIAAQEAGKKIDGESSDSEGDEIDEKSKKEQLYEAKGELWKFAAQAFNESAQTLDFISLVLSKYAPKQGESTLSPFLKQHVPVGTLGTEVLEGKEEEEAKLRHDGLVATGWKLQALSSSADLLLRSASSLEKEMEKEAKYWEEVMSVRQKGWSICRLPREKNSLAVRYGFLEAAPEFRDRGLAALRRDENGSIDLDLGLTSSAPRSIRIQIIDHGTVVAVSQHDDMPSADDRSAETAILQARNNLFDEELFHEMYREARMMTNRGVKCVGDGISIPLDEGVTMFANLQDVRSMDNTITNPSEKYSKLPQLAVTALRILLAHSYRQNYNRRTRPQPPLREQKPPRPVPSILRPIVSHFEHRAALTDIKSHTYSIISILAKAKLVVSPSTEHNSLDFGTVLSAKDLSSGDFLDAIVSVLVAPIRTTQTFILQDDASSQTNSDTNTDSPPDTFSIIIRTHAMGTEYAFSTKAMAPSFLAHIPSEMSFSSATELKEHFSHIVLLWLVDSVERRENKWIASSPNEGELTTEETLNGDYEQLLVQLAVDKGLRLKWNVVGQAEGKSVNWKVKEDDTVSEDRGFWQLVKEYSKLR